MTLDDFFKKITADSNNNRPVSAVLSSSASYQIYPRSVNRFGKGLFFIARSGPGKYLASIVSRDDDSPLHEFEGKNLAETPFGPDIVVKENLLNHANATLIRELLEFTRPVLVGLKDSIGLGDRLGIANPAHLRAVADSHMMPVLAQQSIRELQRTERTPDDVMDAAIWAVLQEGYTGGFGADADHLKTTDDIDLMVRAGFTMFTFDPGEYVVNEADTLRLAALEERSQTLPWDVLADTPRDFLARYENRTLAITEDLQFSPDREEILRALLKYGGVIAHTSRMYRYFRATYPDHPAEFELSVDETESVTSPFEHYLVASELRRLGVELVSLAPRFVGDMEKGIDYKGDLDEFRRQYIKHVKIAEAVGPYKISIHSGSDKFSLYEVIGSLQMGAVHVKTAGTSYLEALRTVAAKAPDLFREILTFARERYEVEKRSYHVSADLDRVPAASGCSDSQLIELFDQNDARQVLHVTFGKVLTAQRSPGQSLFRARIFDCLKTHEDAHYDYLIAHFKRHLDPFRYGASKSR